jgi:hypothetical protein
MATMLKKFLSVCAGALLALSSYAVAVELRGDHPETYVVQRGDTLWDIAARFLKQPWLWPEIWQANPQIENPHLIYPGDVISLAYLGGDRGQPQLQVTRRSPEIRRTALDAIPAVPLSDIEGHLRKTRVLDGDTYRSLPYVIGVEEGRLRVASGEVAYVRGANFQPGQEYAVMRPTVRFAVHPHPATKFPRLKRDDWNARDGLDPKTSGIQWAYFAASDNGFDVLGYEVIEVATGQITRSGDPATLLIAAGGHEVRKGDLLMPVETQPFDLSFHPRPPRSLPANMRILAHTDRMTWGGPRDVVALSAGARDGIENGQVFAIYHPGEEVRDDIRHRTRMAANLPKNRVALPDEFVGHVMVFRTFDKMSYGLIMDGIRPVKLDDRLGMPVDL